jgi:uncharacterized protein (DUF1501 family)
MEITRRHFLRLGGTIGAATVLAPAWLNATELRAAAAGQAPATGRKLVVMLLAGGNDGLNTVVPFGNGDYYSKRPVINIPQAKVLPLPGAPGIGLHPSLATLQSLYRQGRVAIVQGVGYDRPDLSHFGSMDIWQSGNPATRQASGWLGRYLDRTPGRGGAFRAVSIGNSLPKLLTGETTAGIAISSLGGFHFADGADTPGSDAARLHQGYLDCCSGATGDPATDALLSGGRTTVGAVRSIAALAKANSPSTATLADQVATAMTLLTSTLGVEIAMVTLGSFDDHAAENPNHDKLLGFVDAAIGLPRHGGGDRHPGEVPAHDLLGVRPPGQRGRQRGHRPRHRGADAPRRRRSRRRALRRPAVTLRPRSERQHGAGGRDARGVRHRPGGLARRTVRGSDPRVRAGRRHPPGALPALRHVAGGAGAPGDRLLRRGYAGTASRMRSWEPSG